MKILIIDGQSGRVGAQLVENLLEAGVNDQTLIAVGTNALATGAMLKAGAKLCATGENAIIVQSRTADIIAGPVGIVIADALMGEITPSMACAVGQSPATRILLPVNRCQNQIVGLEECSRTVLINEAVQMILDLLPAQPV